MDEGLNLEFGGKLIELEKLLNKNPQELAEIGECSQATYYRYRKNESVPNIEFIAKIINYENKINPYWLLTGKEPKTLNTVTYQTSNQLSGNASDELICVPFFRMTEDNLGEGELSIHEWKSPTNELPVSDKLFKEIIEINPRNAVAITVDCRSMTPEIEKGSLIIGDRSQHKIQADGIFIVRFDEIIRIKLVQILPSNKIRFSTFNKNFDPIEFHKEELDNIEILAKIAWIGNSI